MIFCFFSNDESASEAIKRMSTSVNEFSIARLLLAVLWSLYYARLLARARPRQH